MKIDHIDTVEFEQLSDSERHALAVKMAVQLGHDPYEIVMSRSSFALPHPATIIDHLETMMRKATALQYPINPPQIGACDDMVYVIWQDTECESCEFVGAVHVAIFYNFD